MSRRKIIAGNWKMNKTPSETVKLIEELKPLVKNDDVDVVFCVPAISLTTAIDAVKGTNIAIGAENMFYLTAAAESPPPIIVVASISASACATAIVPLAKFDISNTPIGPFHTTVFALLIAA